MEANRYTPSEIQSIRDNLHLTDPQLAVLLNRTVCSIRRLRRKHGLLKTYNFQEGRTIKLTQLQRLEIYRSGLSTKAIAEKYGIHRHYAQKLKRAA